MAPTLLLFGYGLAIGLASFLGGALPARGPMNHTVMQMVLSLVAGLMLGVGIFHLLPHSVALGPGEHPLEVSLRWLMAGLVVMLLLLRIFHFHQHEVVPAEHGCGHGLDESDAAKGPLAAGVSGLGMTLGLGVHTLIDGVALGAALRAPTAPGDTNWLGFGVFLAILLHKPLDALSISSVLRHDGWKPRAILGVNGFFAVLCPLGAALFYLGAGALPPAGHAPIAAALAFSAGAFICISLSDLLPEVYFHSHDRVKLTLMLLLGIVLAWLVGYLEPASSHAH